MRGGDGSGVRRDSEGGSATGDINYPNDRDWFAVTLEAGKQYRIDLKGSSTGDGTLVDPFLFGIHDADGDLIAGTMNNNSGEGGSLNSRVTFTATADATYYVAAGGLDEVGTYTLSVTESADVGDDYADGTGTTGAVTVGGEVMGEIETLDDRDWFAVTLVAGTSYQIDLKGSPTGDGTLIDPYLYGIHDAAGNFIPGTTDDDGGESVNSQVTFTPVAAGAYYVAAGSVDEFGGTYTLSVTESADVGDDYADGIGTTGTVTVGGEVMGEIETLDDRDWFAVTLEAGKTYQIDLEGSETGGGTLGDTYLYGIHDAAGDLIPDTEDDDGGESVNSRVTFTATADATYYVAAGGLDEVGTYTLSVVEDSM